MVNVIKNQVNYLVTESDIRQMFGKSWPERAIKDYAAMKENINTGANQTDANTQTIETLDARLDILEPTVASINGRLVIVEGQIVDISTRLIAAEGQIVAIDVRLTTAEGEIITLRNDLDTHIAAESAHGATGNIVGTDDYAQPAIGGTVLLADAVASAAPVATTPPAIVAAAGATYSQAHAQTQIDTINALRQNVIDLVAANNALVFTINQMLSTERSAKQRAT